MKSSRSIAVIGVGSAGIVSLCHLLSTLPNSWKITSIHDPNINILGIGESTNPNFLNELQSGIDFNIVDDLEKLDGTFKFGTEYKKWRTNNWVNPLFGSGVAMHFNNFKLKELAFLRFNSIYPDRFSTILGNVSKLESTLTEAIVEVNDQRLSFDYVIDCRGFPSEYSEYELSNCSPVNSGLVYNVDAFNIKPYTEHIARPHGWVFGVPLTSRHSYGYLFNNNISTKEDVIDDMKSFIPDLKEENIIEYSFKSYFTKKILDGRVLKNGNRALFYEPLSASSIYMYVEICRMFTQYLKFKEVNPFDNGTAINNRFLELANDMEDMFAFLYHGGSTLDTPFWNLARERGLHRLASSKKFHKTKTNLLEHSRIGGKYDGDGWFFAPDSLYIIDKKMEYNYFHDHK